MGRRYVLNKVYNNLNIREVNKIDPEAISKLVNKLEMQLINNPNQIELIKKLAQLKYFLLDFEGALKEFEKGRRLDANDIDFLIGEANTRLVLEKESISKKTVELFTKLLEERPSDITALLVLADYNFFSKNYIISKKVTDSFFWGLTTSLINPKILIFFTSVFSQFISNDSNDYNKVGIGLLAGIIDTVWYILVSYSVNLPKLKNYIILNQKIIFLFFGFILINFSIFLVSMSIEYFIW